MAKSRFIKGEDELKPDGDHKTFGITDTRHHDGGLWTNRIEIHGSEELRDLVLRLLKENGQ